MTTRLISDERNLIDTPRTSVTNRFILPQSTKSSISFPTVNGIATLPTSFRPLTTGFSMAGWINPRLLSFVDQARLFNYQASFNKGFMFFKASNDYNYVFNLMNASGTSATANYGNIHSKWTHFCITFAPNNFIAYKNTVSIATDTNCTMVSYDSDLSISTGTANNYKGFVSNLTFQNTTTPWTQAQIDDLYWRNIIPEGATQWSMNDVATDQNGGNELTLTGTSYSTIAPPHMGTRTEVL